MASLLLLYNFYDILLTIIYIAIVERQISVCFQPLMICIQYTSLFIVTKRHVS